MRNAETTGPALASAPAQSGGESGVFPSQPLHHLDTLWIQVAGTRCNLSCTHCFVSCGPADTRHGMMTREQVARRVAEGVALGVREFYFTGGEPFLHPEMLGILADTLEHGPSTVLTNGTLFTAATISSLASLSRSARYSLELRVSLDGAGRTAHDAFRGAGNFERAIQGLRALEAAGLLPIVTATNTSHEDPLVLRERYADALRGFGLSRPRIKLLPMFQLGREASRTAPYDEGESLRDMDPAEFDPGRLQCGSCRAVTAAGVFVCPLLVNEDGTRMSDSLAGALGGFVLRHGACSTCYHTGMTCANG
jgi:MoaA/NifB/PqqE/SkfB family radical SAM enzyme